MLVLIWLSQFKKDFKKAEKSKKDLSKLKIIIDTIQNKKSLPNKNKNHKLKGEYLNCWECHIEPDWLLIYQITSKELILIRTGSHSELF